MILLPFQIGFISQFYEQFTCIVLENGFVFLIKVVLPVSCNPLSDKCIVLEGFIQGFSEFFFCVRLNSSLYCLFQPQIC